MNLNRKNPTGQGGAKDKYRTICSPCYDYSTNPKESKIKNPEYFNVPRDFTNLPIGATDIDGLIDYHNRAFILFETKYQESELPTGQRLALERICDAITTAGKKSIVFVTSHGNDKIIDMARGSVTAYRYGYKWHEPKCEKTLGEAVQWFIDKVDGVKKWQAKPLYQIVFRFLTITAIGSWPILRRRNGRFSPMQPAEYLDSKSDRIESRFLNLRMESRCRMGGYWTGAQA